MVDRQRILEKIDEAERRAGHVADYLPDRTTAYLEDDLTRAAVERSLQVGIEALLDSGGLFVSGLRLGLPSDEATLVEKLEGEVLDADETELLDEMRGFRNVLVHRYGDLDDERVFELARRFPDDVRRLADAYRRALSDLDAGTGEG